MRILYLDIEVAPNLATVWAIFNQNIGINQLLETSRIMCYAAKWADTGKVIFDSEFKSDHDTMMQGLWDLMDEADIIIHYNGNKFDIPVINREFLFYGMSPPTPYKNIDLYRTIKKRFRFTSNKLDHVAQELGLGKKEETGGHQLWLDCMDGDGKAWKKMEKYNRQDVLLLEELYAVILPWIDNHPNMALWVNPTKPTCTNCGSERIKMNGREHTKTQSYQRYKCLDCEIPLRGRFSVLDKDVKENILVQVAP